MAHSQKPDLVFRRNGRVHLNRRRRQFSRLLAAEVCASAVVMLDTPCSQVVRRVLATHFIRQFPHHFPSRASPCAIRFQLDSTIYHVIRSACYLHNWLRITSSSDITMGCVDCEDLDTGTFHEGHWRAERNLCLAPVRNIASNNYSTAPAHL